MCVFVCLYIYVMCVKELVSVNIFGCNVCEFLCSCVCVCVCMCVCVSHSCIPVYIIILSSTLIKVL